MSGGKQDAPGCERKSYQSACEAANGKADELRMRVRAVLLLGQPTAYLCRHYQHPLVCNKLAGRIARMKLGLHAKLKSCLYHTCCTAMISV